MASLLRSLSHASRSGGKGTSLSSVLQLSCVRRSSHHVIRTSTRTFSSGGGMPLHHDWIHPPNSDNNSAQQYQHVVLFLHGLLGNGRNLRTMARKACEKSNQHGLLVDVRGHGGSKILPEGVTPTSFEACVQDLQQTLQSIPQISDDTNVTLVGHSLGGRISLQYAYNAFVSQPSPDNQINRVWLLDTVPGEANESVERVVGAVTDITTHAPITDRNDLVEQLTSPTYKIDKGTAQWLASTLQKSKTNAGSLEFGFDLTVVHDLLADFHSQDFLAMLQQIAATQQVGVDLIRGGKNKGWSLSTLEPLEALEQQYPSNFQMYNLPKAGHWVHVDDLPGVLDVMDVSS